MTMVEDQIVEIDESGYLFEEAFVSLINQLKTNLKSLLCTMCSKSVNCPRTESKFLGIHHKTMNLKV